MRRLHCPMSLSTLFGVASLPSARAWTTTIAPGVEMPWVSLGTCCGSDPEVGVAPWLVAATSLGQPVAGIDTAFDYDDQGAIAAELAATSTPRARVFITTKIPGAAHLHGDPQISCPSRDFRACAVRAVRTDLAQLRVAAADLVLLHDPGLANGTAVSAALWQGMQDALAAGLARSIGVSNFNATQLDELIAQPTTSVLPALNQISMGVARHTGLQPRTAGPRQVCYSHTLAPCLVDRVVRGRRRRSQRAPGTGSPPRRTGPLKTARTPTRCCVLWRRPTERSARPHVEPSPSPQPNPSLDPSLTPNLSPDP